MSKKSLQEILTKEMLEYEYNECGSIQKIADKFNISFDSISKYMKIYNIPYKKHYTGIYHCNHDFFSIDCESSFYWAGFIAADGSLQNKKYSKVLKITLSKKDENHLKKFKEHINCNNPIKTYMVKPSKLVTKICYCSEIQIVSHKIFYDLSKFNIVPNKTKIYDLPNWLIDHPLVHHFMRGYFDGDGCLTSCGLSKNRTITQANFSIIGNYNFINKYQQILIQNNITNTTKIIKYDNIYKLNYCGNNNIRKIFKFLFNNSNIWLDRKYNLFQKYVTEYNPNGALTTI